MMRIAVIVYENGEEYNQEGYSGKELESLMEQIAEIWNRDRNAKDWFEVALAQVSPNDEEDDREALFLTYAEDGDMKPIPEALLKQNAHILGTQIRIQPRRFGMNPWPEDVRVMFTLEGPSKE